MIRKIKEKGITMVALVVTIIVLLILVGVTIAQVTGNNGLFERTRQAVDRYKNESEKEEVELGKLERYLTDFSIVGDDISDLGDEKASVKITGLTAEAITTDSIKVTVTIDGDAKKIEYSIDNGDSWKTGEGTNQQEYTFTELELGSYFIRVRAYDENNKYSEAISKIITLSVVTTAEEPDVLNGQTFISKGELKTGSMQNNGAPKETLSAGKSYIIQPGYYSGGEITSELPQETIWDHHLESRTSNSQVSASTNDLEPRNLFSL